MRAVLVVEDDQDVAESIGRRFNSRAIERGSLATVRRPSPAWMKWPALASSSSIG
jgi:hypothetical protein